MRLRRHRRGRASRRVVAGGVDDRPYPGPSIRRDDGPSRRRRIAQTTAKVVVWVTAIGPSLAALVWFMVWVVFK